MPQATSTDCGTSLFNVHTLKKKNQSLRTEIENHEPRVTLVCNNGQKLIDEEHEDSPEFRQLIEELLQKYQELKEAVETREGGLTQSEKVQQVNIRPSFDVKLCLRLNTNKHLFFFSKVFLRCERSRIVDERARIVHDGGGPRKG